MTAAEATVHGGRAPSVSGGALPRSRRGAATRKRKGLFVIIACVLNYVPSIPFLSSTFCCSQAQKVCLILFVFVFTLNSLPSSVCCSQAKRGNQGQRPKGLFVYFCLCFNLLTSTSIPFLLLFAVRRQSAAAKDSGRRKVCLFIFDDSRGKVFNIFLNLAK